MSLNTQQYLNIVNRVSVIRVSGTLTTPLIRPLAGTSTINIIGGIPEITGLSTANNGVIDVSGSAPPSASDLLRTDTANTASWKGSDPEVSDLPLTGVIAGDYNMATLEIDNTGRVLNATEIYTEATAFNFTAGANVSSITSQSNFYSRVKDGVQTNINITLVLTSSPSVATFTISGLPIASNAGNNIFGNVFIIRDLDLPAADQLSYGIGKVNGTNSITFTLPFSTSPTKNNIRVVGDLVYSVSG